MDPISIQVWGIRIVYSCLGFVRTFFEINEIDSTLEPKYDLYQSDIQLQSIIFLQI